MPHYKIVLLSFYVAFGVIVGWYTNDTVQYLQEIKRKAEICEKMKCEESQIMSYRIE